MNNSNSTDDKEKKSAEEMNKVVDVSNVAIKCLDKFKVVIIEDQTDVMEEIKRNISVPFPNIEIITFTIFDEALIWLQLNCPDVIVLDIVEGEITDQQKTGDKIYNQLWENRFVPVVIYSALDYQSISEIPINHPLIKCIVKGANSEDRLIDEINKFLPIVKLFSKLKEELEYTWHTIMKEVPHTIWNAEDNDDKRIDTLKRVSRRRLAAKIDLGSLFATSTIDCWEIYVVPPLDTNILTGDIFQLGGTDINEPESYRLVLTPSCDLEHGKVENVLMAKCTKISEMIEKGWNIKTPTEKNIKEACGSNFNQPHMRGYVSLPKLPATLPLMSVCLKKLEMVPLTDLKMTGEGAKYRRVASLDSPFRENISWAYSQISGRPGLPERNFEKMTKDILDAIKPSQPGVQ